MEGVWGLFYREDLQRRAHPSVKLRSPQVTGRQTSSRHTSQDGPQGVTEDMMRGCCFARPEATLLRSASHDLVYRLNYFRRIAQVYQGALIIMSKQFVSGTALNALRGHPDEAFLGRCYPVTVKEPETQRS